VERPERCCRAAGLRAGLRSLYRRKRGRVQGRGGRIGRPREGTLLLSERNAPNGYKIEGQGEGGIAGFGKMTATVTLADAEEGGTVLNYVAEAQVGGKLAQIGSRLVSSVANKLAAEFFKRFNTMMSASAEAEAAK
jgi:carbon monoxide dehydrogenase subunit G